MPPEVVAALKKMQLEHYRRWLDQAIPALGGLTPREAAKRKGAPRKALLLLLAEIEHAEAGQPSARRFDVGAMRRELGVTEFLGRARAEAPPSFHPYSAAVIRSESPAQALIPRLECRALARLAQPEPHDLDARGTERGEVA